MSEMARRSEPGTCPDCGGPSLIYRGDHHKWRCSSCIDRYLAEGARKADARLAAEREQRIALARSRANTRTTPTINTTQEISRCH